MKKQCTKRVSLSIELEGGSSSCRCEIMSNRLRMTKYTGLSLNVEVASRAGCALEVNFLAVVEWYRIHHKAGIETKSKR